MQKPDFCAIFTGIIETLGTIREVSNKGTNKTYWIYCPLSSSFKIDQSIAHNGVCLTVEAVTDELHKVTAVQETLKKTELFQWQPGSLVNIERSLLPSSRLDGHFVQGHVDTTGWCECIEEKQGSWEFTFSFHKKFAPLVIEKGSIALNGISLTVFDVKKRNFKVAIIPYTYEHTNLKLIKEGDAINIEFDMLGKYLLRRLNLNKKKTVH
ncbi:MAG TPA: riboflavin synthase [Flavisolibacter sp.]|nr:riboflavin synthase [Flavisolibacter sp.]